MSAFMTAQGPPTSTWVPPDSVVATIGEWLSFASYIVLGLSVLAVIIFGAIMALDRDRAEPVSATAPQVRAFQIALGVMVISSAGSLAGWLAS